jgi:hypothetical protein
VANLSKKKTDDAAQVSQQQRCASLLALTPCGRAQTAQMQQDWQGATNRYDNVLTDFRDSVESATIKAG